MQTLYRFHVGLHTPGETNKPENVRVRAHNALRILTDHYDGLTITKGVGTWARDKEPTMIAEVYGEANKRARKYAQRCARLIAKTLNQNAVGLAMLPVDTFQLITKD